MLGGVSSMRDTWHAATSCIVAGGQEGGWEGRGLIWQRRLDGLGDRNTNDRVPARGGFFRYSFSFSGGGRG